MTEPREIELKLALDPAHIPGLRERGLRRLGAGSSRPERLVSTYYDTDTFALRGKGLSLRVRRAGERRIQTVKAEGAPGAGYFDRSEWETEIEGDEPDLDAFPDTPFGKAVKPKRVRSRVRPIFTTEVERTTWLVEKPDHAVEVTLDHGTVQADGRSVPIAELELELKRGRPDHLFDLARLLDRSSPLAIGVETKSARGYALLNGAAEAVKAAPIELRRGMTAAEAFQVIARSCLRHFRLNEPMLTAARTPAALHQARVALRRLRSGLSLFGPVVSDPRLPGVKTGLRRISAQLGEARNLDVFLGSLAAEADRQPGGLGFAEFTAHVRQEREAAYDSVVATLRSRRFRVFMLDLVAWIETGPWLAAEASAAVRESPIEDFAADLLRRRRRKVRRKGRHLDRLDPPARHDVRIDAKKLRYASEFFGSLAQDGKGRRRHKAFVSALEELQEHLGALNDAATGADLSQKLLASFRDAQAGDVAANVLSRDGPGRASGADLDALVARAVEAHAAFSDTKTFLR